MNAANFGMADKLFSQGMLLVGGWFALMIVSRLLAINRTNDYGTQGFASWSRLAIASGLDGLLGLSRPVLLVGFIMIVAGGAFR